MIKQGVELVRDIRFQECIHRPIKGNVPNTLGRESNDGPQKD